MGHAMGLVVDKHSITFFACIAIPKKTINARFDKLSITCCRVCYQPLSNRCCFCHTLHDLSRALLLKEHPKCYIRQTLHHFLPCLLPSVIQPLSLVSHSPSLFAGFAFPKKTNVIFDKHPICCSNSCIYSQENPTY